VFDAELVAIPGVQRALEALSVARCVASGSTPERIRYSLRLTGLLSYFEPNIFSATQVKRGKPAPDLFEFAAVRMKVPVARSVVIEDIEAGVLAARAAGMRVLGFIGGSHCGANHAGKLRDAGAAAVFSDMRELPTLLES